jgi:hypothetical protein
MIAAVISLVIRQERIMRSTRFSYPHVIRVKTATLCWDSAVHLRHLRARLGLLPFQLRNQSQQADEDADATLNKVRVIGRDVVDVMASA